MCHLPATLRLALPIVVSTLMFAPGLAQDALSPKAAVVTFTENNGQVADQFDRPRPDVLFTGSADGLTYHLRHAGISYTLHRVETWKLDRPSAVPTVPSDSAKIPDRVTAYRLDVDYQGANRDATVLRGETLPGTSHYYSAVCPEGVTGVHSYATITYQDLYPGIDLRWYDRAGKLEYDFEVAPGADYRQITWRIAGADSIRVNAAGELEMVTPLGTVTEAAPIAFQESKSVSASWQVSGNTIGFLLEDVNPELPLTIDPVVTAWSTYFGGSMLDDAFGVAVNDSHQVYMTGRAQSTNNMATVGAHQTSMAGLEDGFVAKFDSSGGLLWATYYGGSSPDWCTDLALGPDGMVYITGQTRSTSGIATPGSHQPLIQNTPLNHDAFLVKFRPNGTRVWGTYYGGGLDEQGRSIAIDSAYRIYLSGWTRSNDAMATAGAHKTAIVPGFMDAFLVQFDSAGSRQWGTYFGGTAVEEPYDCVTDHNQAVYLTGVTLSTNGIATAGAHQNTMEGVNDAFLARFDHQGVLQWGTYLGDSLSDWGTNLAVHDDTLVYVLGTTGSSSRMATPGSHQPVFGGGSLDMFLNLFTDQGTRTWGTYYGGSGWDWSRGMVVDSLGNLNIVGHTDSPNQIATPGAAQTAYGGGLFDAVIAQLSPQGLRHWGTYFGGADRDEAFAVAQSSFQSLSVAGRTGSNSQIATAGAHQTTLNNNSWDAFVTGASYCPMTSEQLQVSTCGTYTSPSGQHTWETSGVYLDTLTNMFGCDSILAIDLAVLQSADTLTASACADYTSPSGLHTWTIPGTYSDTLTNANGCDSLLTIHLSLLNSSAMLTMASCAPYLSPSGQAWTTSGTYTDTITNAQECDSIITIQLSILPTSADTIAPEVCNFLLSPSGNHIWTQSGTYHDTLTNAQGCDSLLTVQLTVAPPDTSVLLAQDSLFALSASGPYQWLDCGNGLAPIMGANQALFVPQQSGSYAVQVGDGECMDTSACKTVIITGLADAPAHTTVQVYPNPTAGNLVVELTSSARSALRLTDLLGRTIHEQVLHGSQRYPLTVPGPPGLYFLTISGPDDAQVVVKVVKR